MQPIRTPYCQPAPTSNQSPNNAAGVAPHTCPLGQECRYWWFIEDQNLGKTPYSDTVGFCIKYTNYTYDDGTGTLEPFPSCTTLSPTDTDGDSVPDNVMWGCAPAP